MSINSKYNLRVFKTTDELNIAAAEFVIAEAKEAIAARGRFIISLSGGQTPNGLYSLLAKSPWREQIEWIKTFIFWGDERYARFDDDRNNAHHAKSILFDNIGIPSSNIHFIDVNLQPDEAAKDYEKDIKAFFGNEALRFDLVLLGLGENGHTASLFPGTNVIDEKGEGVRDLYVGEEKMYRITMTAPLINQARHILFLVTGINKSEVLKNILSEPYQPQKYPAQLINPNNGELHWFVDEGAAALMTI
ncbi:MAG TPA: 6-phosphogluconolactonase [Cyclobacteriaceae bacterium]|jgi:6-phosphogluconolactonase|nr:6-phosphogluconolactonase [Cyclobacteriaceae bacterium]